MTPVISTVSSRCVYGEPVCINPGKEMEKILFRDEGLLDFDGSWVSFMGPGLQLHGLHGDQLAAGQKMARGLVRLSRNVSGETYMGGLVENVLLSGGTRIAHLTNEGQEMSEYRMVRVVQEGPGVGILLSNLQPFGFIENRATATNSQHRIIGCGITVAEGSRACIEIAGQTTHVVIEDTWFGGSPDVPALIVRVGKPEPGRGNIPEKIIVRNCVSEGPRKIVLMGVPRAEIIFEGYSKQYFEEPLIYPGIGA